MIEPEILPEFEGIVRDAFGDPTIRLTAESVAGDVPGWDSLKQVMIIIGVEERFGIRLSSSEMDHIACVGDFLRLIKAKTGG